MTQLRCPIAPSSCLVFYSSESSNSAKPAWRQGAIMIQQQVMQLPRLLELDNQDSISYLLKGQSGDLIT